MAVTRADMLIIIGQFRAEIDTEISNLDSFYREFSAFLMKFSRNYRRLAVSSVLIPFITGVSTTLIAVSRDEWHPYLIAISAIFSLGLVAVQCTWELFGYSRRAAVGKSICDRVTEAKSKIQKEIPSEKQISILSDQDLRTSMRSFESLRNYVIDERNACHNLATGTIITLLDSIHKYKGAEHPDHPSA